MNYKSFYSPVNTSQAPIVPQTPKYQPLEYLSSTAENFQKTLGGNIGKPAIGGLDAWKLMIKDDVRRFENETEEKKIKKRMMQADYKNYLERQMDHHRALKVQEDNENQEDGIQLKSKVQKMTEQENLKRKLASDRTKAVSFENNQAIHGVHERMIRERQNEIAREKERLADQQLLEHEKVRNGNLAKEQAIQQLGINMAKLRCQARGMSSTIEHQGNHLTPINTKKKGDIDGTISSIKTRNYWNYVDS